MADKVACLVGLALLAGACATAPVRTQVALNPETATEIAQAAPEPPGATATRDDVRAARHMIVAAHPLAAETGLTILRQGGSAIDAAIAAELVLGLVEPQSSGLGGGAFMLRVALEDPPYNYVLQTAPVMGSYEHEYHWHFEIIPKLTKFAGFEWGSGFFINPTPPEEAAKYLRDLAP